MPSSSSSQVAVLSLLVSFTAMSGVAVVHAADAAPPSFDAGEPAEPKSSGLTSEEISYILMGACALVIVIAGILMMLRMRHNTKRFAQQNAYFDRFRMKPMSPRTQTSEEEEAKETEQGDDDDHASTAYEVPPATPTQAAAAVAAQERQRAVHEAV